LSNGQYLSLRETRVQIQQHESRQADQAGDDGKTVLLVSDVIHTNALGVWFLSEHVVDVPLARADEAKAASCAYGGTLLLACPAIRRTLLTEVGRRL